MNMNDFKKYATKHLGISSMVLDDVTKLQASYLNPYILEERQLNVTQLDVFSRLMMDRIIFLPSPGNCSKFRGDWKILRWYVKASRCVCPADTTAEAWRCIN